jgi:hypothetical protein
MSTPADLSPQEIASALAARRELGPDYEEAIASALAEKMAKEINARVSAELAVQGATPGQARPPKPRREHEHGRGGGGASSTFVAIGSLIAGIPITAIVAATSHGSVVAIGVSWLGIGLVNMAHSLSRRHD